MDSFQLNQKTTLADISSKPTDEPLSPLILPAISVSMAEDLPKTSEIKSNNTNDQDSPLKKSAGFFDRKVKKRQTEVIKEPKVANPPKSYKSDLTFYRDAIEHRKNTEEALLKRIKPIDLIQLQDETIQPTTESSNLGFI